MSPNIGGTMRTVTVALATSVGLMAHTAMAQSIQGTATYRERMAQPERRRLHRMPHVRLISFLSREAAWPAPMDATVLRGHTN
jgi:hypothetical protein